MVGNIHVLVVPEEEYAREPAGDCWCFACRKRLPHDWVCFKPVDPLSYYGPRLTRLCSGCGRDRTAFPGYARCYETEE